MGRIFYALFLMHVLQEGENEILAQVYYQGVINRAYNSGDRRMGMDDGASKRLTLKKGRHVITGSVINGPGMSDFCLRFIDEKGNPVVNYKILK